MKLSSLLALLAARLLWCGSALGQVPTNTSAPVDAPSSVGIPAATLVVLIADEPGDVVSARLERDLRSLGLAVMLLRATPENSSDVAALERCVRGFGGVAAVRVWGNARGSQLWIFEPAAPQTVTRSLARPVGANADPNEVALGTLELLRASLLELYQPRPSLVASSRSPAVAEPQRAVASARLAPARFALSGALAADLGLRSVGPSPSSLWAAWLRVGDCFGVRGFVALPLSAEVADVPEGRVEVEPVIVGAGLSCSFAYRGGLLWPRAALGAAGARVSTRGVAADPSRSHQGAAWLGGGYGTLGLGLRLTRDVHLNFDVMGLLLPTPATIFVAGRQVATWGAPAGVVSLGVEVLARD